MTVEKETVHGKVEHITYKNQQTGYTVFKLATEDGELVAVGNFPYISNGDMVILTGEYTVHQTYGEQFRAESCEKETPTTTAAILRYLSSGAVKGIGPATAAKIIRRFGSDALDIIKDSPERLSEIRGISQDKATQISSEYKKQFGLQELMLFLSKFKASPEDATKVYKEYANSAIDRIKENPYILCGENIGFSFDRADEIAESLGYPSDSENRIFAGIEFIMRHNLSNGHTCLPRKKVCEIASDFLGCDKESADTAVEKLLFSLRLRSKELDGADFLFLPDYYSAEEYIASRLALYLSYGKEIVLDELEIDHIENRLHIKYDDMQRDAIKTAHKRCVLVLTGGPGTGKTTTLNGLIELFERKEMKVLLAAPTGRAAKRMSELTGMEAKTLHRLLEVQWGEGDRPYFERNERNPLVCDVIIVDEMSMVDTFLFESLLRALRLGTRIILVGDSDQLPSVSAGNILHDIIESGEIPAVCLKKIFRQSDSGLIVKNAHAIINGEMPILDSKTADFFMMNKSVPSDAAQTVVDLCTKRLPKAYGFSPLTDIQVLCPSRKLEMGTVNLNMLLQQELNPQSDQSKQLTYGGFSFREGDKVMQTRNNYDIMWQRDNGEQGNGVYNGDIGFIEKADAYSQLITVRFDDRIATYYSTDISQLEPAYAITVHKSQGSEFNCVILPLLSVPSQLVYRNLLYTAVTRAKRMLIIVGDSNTVCKMVENDRKTLRYSGLKTMIKETFDVQNFE